jgi:signal-transduction protein with cAMP-binding, CBS, and nucleotidyltransferase domain
MHNLGHLALMQMPALQPQWDRPTAGEWTDVLATFPLFTGVSKRHLRRLARNATLAEFAPGETIVFAGDADEALYIILSGRAKTTSMLAMFRDLTARLRRLEAEGARAA